MVRMKSPRIVVAGLVGNMLWLWAVHLKWIAILIFSPVMLAVIGCQPSGPLFDDMRFRREQVKQVEVIPRERLWGDIRVVPEMVPRGRHGRRIVRPMTPRYITVHSTQNYSSQADALRHALALQRGALKAPRRRNGNRIGYLIWHYSVDDRRVVQHMPTYEQGEHADFDGPGNRYSIGIEMCENRGSDLASTVNRTAKLCALLMQRYGIPLSNVVPHYHWPRRGLSTPHKDCPNFLLDDGKPGAKWDLFTDLVNAYYQRLQ